MRKWLVPKRQDCRIVIFYRVAPDRAKITFPTGYQLREINGYAVGGIAVTRRCVIHPSLLPTRLVARETVLHFVHALRAGRQQVRTGALVLRHDTSSRWKSWVRSGWQWRQPHHHARVRFVESPDSINIQCDSDDRLMHVAIRAQPRQCPSHLSVFPSRGQLLRMLCEDLPGLRLAGRSGRYRSANRSSSELQMVPLQVEHLESSLFDDPQRFPGGAAEFDSAYSLRDTEVVWSEQGAVCCDIATA